MERSIGRGFEICAHIMLGLPGESHADMMATAREVATSGLDAVKIHNLYAVEKTPLAEQVRSGEVQLMEFDDYITTLVDFLELLPNHGDRANQRRGSRRLFHWAAMVPGQTGDSQRD